MPCDRSDPAGNPDLNRLVSTARWDADLGRFVRDEAPPSAKSAHVYGFYRNEPVDLSNLVAIIDCTKPGVLSPSGHLNGKALAQALKLIIAARFDKGTHDTRLCDHYDVTYVSDNGTPLHRDRWVALTPAGIATNPPESERLARVSDAQVFCLSMLLGSTASVLRT